MGRIALMAALSAATLALLLVAVELGSYVALRALAARDARRPLPPSSMPAYRAHAWADTFWREQKEQLSLRYLPFGLWVSRPFAGRTIVVDDEGRRHTAHTRCAPGDPVVFLFGGSSVWGYGSPDWETLPSHLAARFAAAGRPACVANYGQDSWRTTQGVTELMLELRRGRRPQQVVFLAGCNDVFTPFFLTGDPEVEWDFARAKPWLEELARPAQGSFAFLQATNAWALLQRLRGRLRGPRPYPAPRDPDDLARAVARTYLADLDLAEALGRAYGFRARFFLQPLAVQGGRALTAEEEAGARRQMGLSYDLARDAASRTYALLRRSGRASLGDASDAFDKEPGSVYIDACHFLPLGNRLLADRLYSELQ